MFNKNTTIVMVTLLAFSVLYTSFVVDDAELTGNTLQINKINPVEGSNKFFGGNNTNITKKRGKRFLPDLVIEKFNYFAYNQTNSTNITNVRLEFIVGNIGGRSARSSWLNIRLDNVHGWTEYRDFNIYVPVIPAGKSVKAQGVTSLKYPTTWYGIATADTYNTIRELNEHNNNATFSVF